MRRPVVLSLTPWLPARGATYAGHRFYFEYLTLLSERFDVVVVAPHQGDNPETSRLPVPWRAELVPALARPTGWRAEIAALRLAGRDTPVPDLGNFAKTNGVRPDVVELHWSPLMALAPAARAHYPSSFLAVFQHDRYSATLSWPRLGHLRLRARARDTLAGRVIALEERLLVRYLDLVAAFKASDVSYVGSKGRHVVVLDPWLDQPLVREVDLRTKDVLFVGAFDRAENAQAALWFVDRAWPLVVQRHPDAHLVLAGARPGPALLQRSGGSVEVTGYLDELAPAYARARCFAAPLFSGGGVRFKVAQALVAGTPLIASPVALEGFDGLPAGAVAQVADGPEDFAAAICHVIESPDESERRARQAQEWARGRFSFRSSVDAVLRLYDEAAKRGQGVPMPPPRAP